MQVFRLEQRLADVHAADVNALDRAHKTLCQHVDALESDAKACFMSELPMGMSITPVRCC